MEWIEELHFLEDEIDTLSLFFSLSAISLDIIHITNIMIFWNVERTRWTSTDLRIQAMTWW